MAYRQSSENAEIDLLRSIVSDEEWKRFQQAGMLEIRGKAGIYRVSRGEATQLIDSETRRPVAAIRWQPASTAVGRERIIAEYLLIRNEENRYWETAKVLPERSGPNLYIAFLLAALDALLLIVLLAQFR